MTRVGELIMVQLLPKKEIRCFIECKNGMDQQLYISEKVLSECAE